MKLEAIRAAIEHAISVALQQIEVPGISGAELNEIFDSKRLQAVAAQLENRKLAEARISAAVAFFLRVSNGDVLESIQCIEFEVKLNVDGNGSVCGVASSLTDWAECWDHGFAPFKEAALQSMRNDVLSIDGTLSEDSATFRSAMILFSSEMVGPYVERIASFLDIPCSFVDVVAVRLLEARIWEGDQVRCESWFDPKKGGATILLDVMVAAGEFIRSWSVEKNDYVYRVADMRSISHMAI